ncbi:ABC transporter permease [Leadbetterella byssophila]|uniref:ABC transporter permease n=1 Tax=Leadbetterella byssophila TaxID=316068 RepID=UPI0039A2EFF4
MIAQTTSPLQVMVNKEMTDHIKSRRFLILLGLLILIFAGTLYLALIRIKDVPVENDANFVILKLFSLSDGSLPTFHVFLNFLGPLLGIAMGFDAINGEWNKRTLIRIMAQPVYRDHLLLAKFFGAIQVLAVLFFSISLIMIGAGIFYTGVLPEPAEVLRILAFTLLNLVYISFWLGLAICSSVYFKNVATSALVCIGIWLFLTIIYKMLVNAVAAALVPKGYLMPEEIVSYQQVIINFLRLDPGHLYNDAATTLLLPSVRSVSAISMEQMSGAIPAPLSFMNSLLAVWPQVTGLLAGTTLWFALAYYLFMRKEIKA